MRFLATIYFYGFGRIIIFYSSPGPEISQTNWSRKIVGITLVLSRSIPEYLFFVLAIRESAENFRGKNTKVSKINTTLQNNVYHKLYYLVMKFGRYNYLLCLQIPQDNGDTSEFCLENRKLRENRGSEFTIYRNLFSVIALVSIFNCICVIVVYFHAILHILLFPPDPMDSCSRFVRIF